MTTYMTFWTWYGVGSLWTASPETDHVITLMWRVNKHHFTAEKWPKMPFFQL